MNASDLQLPTESNTEEVGLDVVVLTRVLICSAALMTLVTFGYILA